MPYSPYYDYFSTESMTWNFAKELPTLSMHWKVIPELEPTLPEGLLPDADIPNPIQELTLHYAALMEFLYFSLEFAKEIMIKII